ncbi:hypothetical protein [Candidatus Marinarcus aquaticus]|uniref:Uncharacterized protein n=1 Tax=Candidatus Marinarcus aquaticus TaxID=2044504 RepID=A0A4Q0XUF6_9BACT|nr:hypothetical protein [Candidatus Marinarcus aquaticus]RXJ60174.1 hypothetical protein CRV04_04000 [Candidatus Marinarcus aquaticus]
MIENRRRFIEKILFSLVLIKLNLLSNSIDVKQKLKLYKVEDISSESTEGGLIEYLFDMDNKLKKVNIIQCWERGKLEVELFIKENRIFKLIEIKQKYNRPFYYTQEIAQELGDNEWFDEKKKNVITTIIYKDNKLAYQTINNQITKFNENLYAQYVNYVNKVKEKI